ncbi:MAG: Arc family DNA-binding protein [Verrucomicrobiota bacterium]
MKAVTLKAVPEDLVEALKSAAVRNHRSLSGEILHRLHLSVSNSEGGVTASSVEEKAGYQADAWEKLTGDWNTGLPVEEEIAALYEARSGGRDQDLTW